MHLKRWHLPSERRSLLLHARCKPSHRHCAFNSLALGQAQENYEVIHTSICIIADHSGNTVAAKLACQEKAAHLLFVANVGLRPPNPCGSSDSFDYI